MHNGQHQKLTLVQRDENKGRITALRLWPANVETTDDATRIWIGTVSYLYIDKSLPLISYLRTAPDFDSPLVVLSTALAEEAAVKPVKRDVIAPAGMEWQGEVLLGVGTSVEKGGR